MIRMMATTISSSISEKPFCCLRISNFPLVLDFCCFMLLHGDDAVELDKGTCPANPASYLGSCRAESKVFIFITSSNFRLIVTRCEAWLYAKICRGTDGSRQLLCRRQTISERVRVRILREKSRASSQFSEKTPLAAAGITPD